MFCFGKSRNSYSPLFPLVKAAVHLWQERSGLRQNLESKEYLYWNFCPQWRLSWFISFLITIVMRLVKCLSLVKFLSDNETALMKWRKAWKILNHFIVPGLSKIFYLNFFIYEKKSCGRKEKNESIKKGVVILPFMSWTFWIKLLNCLYFKFLISKVDILTWIYFLT